MTLVPGKFEPTLSDAAEAEEDQIGATNMPGQGTAYLKNVVHHAIRKPINNALEESSYYSSDSDESIGENVHLQLVNAFVTNSLLTCV